MVATEPLGEYWDLARSFFARHWRHAALLFAFILTGLGIFSAPLRSALGPALPWVQALHTYGGLLYGAGLLVASLRLFPWPPKGGTASHRTAFALVVVLVLSGLGLLFGRGAIPAVATWVHALAAAGLVVWLIVHLVDERPKRWFHQYRADGTERPGISRRNLLRWGFGGLLALPAAYYLPGMLRLGVGAALGGGPSGPLSESGGTLPGFVPYTVTDGYPAISRAAYRLRIEGLADGPRAFTYPDLTAMRAETRRLDFTCVTGWAVDGVAFRGIDLQDMLLTLGWQPARQPWVTFRSGDRVYWDGLDARQIARYRPLVAWEINGRPLPRTQGAPVRLVVPGMYGYKSVKWLTGIGLGQDVVMGYWEDRGYPENAYIGSYQGL